MSSLNQRLGITPLFMAILVLMFLPSALASPGRANTGSGNKNTAIALAAATAVAIAGTNIWTNRTKRFKTAEQDLEEMCLAKNVRYCPLN